MYQYLLFDLDGTITDPGVGITNGVMYALDKYKIEIKDRTSLYEFIGPPLQDSFRLFYGFSEEESLNAVGYYREYYREKGIYENKVYEGIENMLYRLKEAGKTIMLATSKPEEFANQILEHFSLDKYFDFVAGASMDGTRQKKAEIIEHALQKNQVTDLSKVIMIGDRKYDILGAKQVGVDSMGVLFGYGSEEELKKAGATYIAKSVQDIGDRFVESSEDIGGKI